MQNEFVLVNARGLIVRKADKMLVITADGDVLLQYWQKHKWVFLVLKKLCTKDRCSPKWQNIIHNYRLVN
jgi:hypothetical protein